MVAVFCASEEIEKSSRGWKKKIWPIDRDNARQGDHDRDHGEILIIP